MTEEKFDQFNLKRDLLWGIFNYGFEYPSSIQCLYISKILTGNDVIIQGPSKLGKTSSYIISLLQKLDETKKVPQVLILSPTRELAQQTFEVIKSIGCKMNISAIVLYGGQSVDEDRKKCKENPQVVVGCPGRVQQMIKEGYLDTRQIIMHIIDEADEMFERNFAESMTYIMEHIPETAQMVLVSATMPKEVVELTQQFMPKAERILLKDEELTLDGIRHYKIELEESCKENILAKTLLKVSKILQRWDQCIIFVNKIQKAENLKDLMKKQGYGVEIITSDMEQTERNERLEKFKKGEFRYLIGTDIIAKDIDVQSVTCVINYDIPRTSETYLHRVGYYESLYFGRRYIAINFVTPRNKDVVKEIEEKYIIQFEEIPEKYRNTYWI